MSVSPTLIIITAVIYAFVAVDQILKNNWGFVIMYGGYAVSNIGILMLMK